MTLPRTAAQVLSGHVMLEIRCIDRMLLTVRQPRLQYGQGIHGFFCHHRGNQFVSSALMHPMTDRFAADIHHYIAARDILPGSGPSAEALARAARTLIRLDIKTTPENEQQAVLNAARLYEGYVKPLTA